MRILEWILGLFFAWFFSLLIIGAIRADSQKDTQNKKISIIKADCLSIQRQINDMQSHIKGLEKTMIEHWKALDNKLKDRTAITE